ncbi:heparinase II/III domain-containing protein [Kribbella kalugense]|uniref:Heparinase II/III-like protein n=1 Tax=Kribbella kalugense TaxID=2512221 RepID=A0A4R8A1X4_9ACTN|nr:heparinase II/III family protein [Kribbella kalugense]TDW24513.1 heparinase II/III-like protein [Kribbella kalugense]
MPQTLRHLLPEALLTRSLDVPTAEAWDGVPASDRTAILEDAEEQLATPWPVLLASDYARFHRDGDRDSYETPYFARRRRIVIGALAALLTGEQRWVADVVDGVWLVCDEANWAVPAHASSAHARSEALPRPGDRDLDLFCAETGSLLAWVDALLGPALDPSTRVRIATEVDRRVLTPFLEIRDWHWLTGFTNNWNPWIHSNVTACALLLEPDPARRAKIVSLVVDGLDVFLDSYPDDGGCDEGASYWTRAGGAVGDALALLYDASAGELDGFGHPKLRAITSYLPAMHIDGRWYVNFADCPAQLDDPSVAYPLYRLGVHTDEPSARQHARAIRRRDDPLVPRIPSMFRMVGMLLEQGLRADEEPVQVQDTWLPDTEVLVARSDRLLVALKGGHNAESHNHNDVGSFIVAVDGVPRVVDLGVGTYTKQTFSADRYQIFTMQSDYHNLPKINGQSQLAGREYHATDMSAELGDAQASCQVDLAAAYPADIRSWRRGLILNRTSELLEVTDSWELQDTPQSLVWHLIINGPVTAGNGTVEVDGLTISYDGLELTVEPLPLSDPRLLAIWGNHLTRLVLSAQTPTPTGTTTMTFAPSIAP